MRVEGRAFRAYPGLLPSSFLSLWGAFAEDRGIPPKKNIGALGKEYFKGFGIAVAVQ